MTNFQDWFSTLALSHYKKLSGMEILTGNKLSNHAAKNILEEPKYNIKLSYFPLGGWSKIF